MRKSSISSQSRPARTAASAATRRTVRRYSDDGGTTRCTLSVLSDERLPHMLVHLVRASRSRRRAARAVEACAMRRRFRRDARSEARSNIRRLRMLRRMDGRPQITITFPGDAGISPSRPPHVGRRGKPGGLRLRGHRRPAYRRERAVQPGLGCAERRRSRLAFQVERGHRRGRRVAPAPGAPRRERVVADDRRRGRRRVSSCRRTARAAFRCTKRSSTPA